MQRVLHMPHHGIRGAGEAVGAVRQGQRGADGDLFPVAHDMHDAFVGSFGHPACQQQRAVHILGRVGTGVCRELLDAQDSGLVGAGPAALGVQILHRLDRCDALGRSNGVDVVLGKAEGGEDAKVEYVLLYVIFLSGDPHTGRKAGKARQDHHAQRHDAKQGQKPAQVAPEIPEDVFSITFLHKNHHSICSTGTGCSLTWLDRICPLFT